MTSTSSQTTEAQGSQYVLPAGNKAFAEVFKTQSALGTDHVPGHDLKNYVPLKSLRVLNLPDVVPRVRPAQQMHALMLYICCFCACVRHELNTEGIMLHRELSIVLRFRIAESRRGHQCLFSEISSIDCCTIILIIKLDQPWNGAHHSVDVLPDNASGGLQEPCFPLSPRYLWPWLWWKGIRFLLGSISGLLISDARLDWYMGYRHGGQE